MKMISLKVPESMDEELARRAADRGVSKSDLVREAVAEYLVEGGTPTPGPFLAAAADLVGCVDGGPEDLSYNPEHLAGYGR
jgi:hypothetical protein